MASAGPPAYAWDWFTRQRLLWREARMRLCRADSPIARRYCGIHTRSDVVPALRADYPRNEVVHRTVDAVVRELVFLGLTDRRFDELGIDNAPRGMRWWWTALTGEDLEAATRTRRSSPTHRPDDSQLSIDAILEGYGD